MNSKLLPWALMLTSTAAMATSNTETLCPHLPLASTDSDVDAMAQDIVYGAPVAYVPFELSDHPVVNWTESTTTPGLFNGTRVSSVGVLSTDLVRIPKQLGQRPNGSIYTYDSVVVPACDYYSTINGIENHLNSLGKSLRDSDSRFYVKETVIGPADEAVFNNQIAQSQAVTNTSPAAEGTNTEVWTEVVDRYNQIKGPAGVATAQNFQADGLNITYFNASVSGAFANKFLASYKKNFRCPTQSFGWEKSFYADIGCNLSMNYWDANAIKRIENDVTRAGNYPNQKGYSAKVEGSAFANGAVFGLEFPILTTSFVGRTYPNGSVDAKISAQLMGKDLLAGAPGDPGKLKRNNLRLSKSASAEVFNVEESVSTTIVVGPVPVSLEVGARGGGVIDYTYALAGLKADAGMAPNFFVEGFASVGVDLLVVGAGVEANLTVIDATLEQAAHVNVFTPAGQQTPVLDIGGTVFNELTVVSGNIDIVAWVMVPRLAWVPFVKKEIDYTLFDWDGFQTRGSLFAYQRSYDLYR